MDEMKRKRTIIEWSWILHALSKQEQGEWSNDNEPFAADDAVVHTVTIARRLLVSRRCDDGKEGKKWKKYPCANRWERGEDWGELKYLLQFNYKVSQLTLSLYIEQQLYTPRVNVEYKFTI